MDRAKKTIICLAIIIALETTLGTFFLIGYSDLLSTHEKTTAELSVLQSLYSELEENHTSLEEAHRSLETGYQDLMERYTSLEETYDGLTDNFTLLRAQYTDLAENWSRHEITQRIEEALRIGNSLQSYYDLVRQEKGLDGTKGSWNPDQDQVEFAAKLGSHDLGNPYLPDIEAEFERTIGEPSYLMARRKIDEVISLIGVAQSHALVEKIARILNFTCQHVRYEYDVMNVYRAPVETLGLRSGDCDDYSILVATLFEAVGIDSAVGSFKNKTEAYHYMILVHLEDLPGYEYQYFPDLTHVGLQRGTWIVIEPQYLIEHQGDEWVRQWILLTATEVED